MKKNPDAFPFDKGKYLILCKFRTMNHLLPTEKGRHLAFDYDNRPCSLCTYQAIGDEFHYLFECS
jgi:hypothetical protein